MAPYYYLGIPEIDVQHDEIRRIVAALQNVIASKSQQYLIGPAMKRLNQLLVSHFAAEEALMEMIGYSDLPKHKKMHSSLLQLIDDYLHRPQSPPAHDGAGKAISDEVLAHVMEHDSKLIDMVQRYLGAFQDVLQVMHIR
jgi:hemerythrin